MQSGVITDESLVQLFRTLSQKRRFGALEMTSGAEKLEVLFHNGRIVGAHRVGEPCWKAVAERLARAGLIGADETEALSKRDPQADEVECVFVEEFGVDKSDYLRAKLSAEMDLLYGMRKLAVGHYNFRSEMFTIDPAACLDVAPGQLLLDYVELDSDLAEFYTVFDRFDSTATRVVRKSDSAPDNLPAGARCVWEQLSPEACLKQICDLSMLSEYELKESLNTLYLKNLVEVVREADQHAPAELSSSWKQSLENLEDPLMSLVDQAAEFLSDFKDEPEVKDSGSDSAIATANDVAQVNQAFKSTNKELNSRKRAKPQSKLFVARFARVFHRAWRAQQTLLEDESLEVLTIVLAMIFLWSLAFVGPDLIQHWFASLANFSSSVSTPVIK